MKKTFEEQLEQCRQIMLHDTCPLTDEDIDRIILSIINQDFPPCQQKKSSTPCRFYPFHI